MVVERARGESQSMSGSRQSLCWGSAACGGIVSSYFSGSLVDVYGVRSAFGVTPLLPLITSAVSLLVKEEHVHCPARGLSLGNGFFESSKSSIIQLWGAVKQSNVFLPTLFIFLFQATPQSGSATFFFITNKLGFTPEFLGRLKLVTAVASLIGVALYNGFLKKVPLRKIFFVTSIIGSALGMTQVLLVTGLNRKFGISDEWFSIGDSLILFVLGQVAPYNTFYSLLEEHLNQVGIDPTINRWDVPVALGVVDPHDSLPNPAGVSDVQTESASPVDPDQFTNFLIPNWFEGQQSGSTKDNPFPLPDAYLASQQRNLLENHNSYLLTLRSRTWRRLRII